MSARDLMVDATWAPACVVDGATTSPGADAADASASTPQRLATQAPAPMPSPVPPPGAAIAELIAILDNGAAALLRIPKRGPAVLRARCAVDLHAQHLGGELLLAFEDGDPTRPIVTGVLRGRGADIPASIAGQVEFDVDGARVLVSAQQQLVLRCGQASITLSADGAVVIEGSYISSQSSGVNRLWGGAIQLN